jgi:hypothetical protein
MPYFEESQQSRHLPNGYMDMMTGDRTVAIGCFIEGNRLCVGILIRRPDAPPDPVVLWHNKRPIGTITPPSENPAFKLCLPIDLTN